MVWSKEQAQKYARDWRAKHREQTREYERKYHGYLHPYFIIPLQIRNWRNKVARRISSRKYYKQHPEIVIAHRLAKQIPLAEFCEMCPEDEIRKATERHHPDYDFPEIIVSCCKECHELQKEKGK